MLVTSPQLVALSFWCRVALVSLSLSLRASPGPRGAQSYSHRVTVGIFSKSHAFQSVRRISFSCRCSQNNSCSIVSASGQEMSQTVRIHRLSFLPLILAYQFGLEFFIGKKRSQKPSRPASGQLNEPGT